MMVDDPSDDMIMREFRSDGSEEEACSRPVSPILAEVLGTEDLPALI